MIKERVHVISNRDQEGWDVKKSGSSCASVYTRTKEEAVKIGRIMSQRSGIDLIIHGRDGNIQRADNYGCCVSHLKAKDR
ncbi:MAG TPA: DUF2188 domain-containing protein [Oscillospiraceae bacterium]|nr:DUF2188 domain-containing protein [Oscillospiraceae bacterium]HPK35994.1 DUF2188 domain-containing protein [Oscillospiraceae bacterium]